MCKSATLKTYLCERSEKNVTEFIEYIMKKFLKDEYEERRKIHEDEVHVSLKKNQFVNKQLIIIYLFSFF